MNARAQREPATAARNGRPTAACSAFTLLELLVVLAIIGILASIALPSIRGMRQSSGLAAASRQLLDDAALARRLAIQNRTTVLMVFMPALGAGPRPVGLNAEEYNILLRGQLTSYALFAGRQVGDQPGREHARYLKGWKALPDGYFIPEWKFTAGMGIVLTNLLDDTVTVLNALPFYQKTVPIPSLNSVNRPIETIPMPYIAFGPEGRLQKYDIATGAFVNLPEDEVLPVARGSILLPRRELPNDPKDLEWTAPDVAERPAGNSTNNYNLVVIDHVTGRGRLVRPEIQ
jgi:prepilin-type N-terminal cleavage/methylation domain-containing protein